jgi:hypothetical protein
VILSELVCARLRALAPSLLFHGTGFMSAILADDAVGADEEYIYATVDPQFAAHQANRRREGDEGRGGIVAFDRVKLASLSLIYNLPTVAWHPRDRLIYVPLYLLREYVVDTFWLDGLSPTGGVEDPRADRVLSFVEQPCPSPEGVSWVRHPTPAWQAWITVEA